MTFRVKDPTRSMVIISNKITMN